MTINDIREHIENDKTRNRSAWDRGVTAYAMDLLDQLQESIDYGDADLSRILEPRYLQGVLLNGAESWKQYSWGGCSLCYDGDIAKRLCAPSELKKTRNGERRPNGHEEWLDVQTRAIYQAANRIFCAAKAISREEARA